MVPAIRDASPPWRPRMEGAVLLETNMKFMTYAQNHDGEREFFIEAFNDDGEPSTKFVYIVQQKDGMKPEMEIIKLPRTKVKQFAEQLLTAVEKFK